jgi:polyadenylate-binding protein 2
MQENKKEGSKQINKNVNVSVNDSVDLSYGEGEIEFNEEAKKVVSGTDTKEEQEESKGKEKETGKNTSIDQQAIEEADKKSIYVKNVDFSTTPEELEDHFKKCGDIDRITILCDKYTGQPKGYSNILF